MPVIQIPMFLVDAVVLATTTGLSLMNRDPEVDEVDVPADTLITVEVTHTGAAAVDLANTSVYVGGVLAFSGGTFQAGFTGAGSAFSNPQADTLRIIIDKLVNFDPEQVVTVRVVSQAVGGTPTIDQTYSFTIVDTSAPQVLSAAAVTLRKVRVTFDDPVVQVDPTAADDALNPANYTLVRLDTVPSVEASVVSVDVVSSSVVELTMSRDLTIGAAYRVIVGPVENVGGLAVVSPVNDADFAGYQPPVPASRSFRLEQFIPYENIARDASGDLRRFLSVLQEVVDISLAEIDRWTQILDCDLADEQFVDALLASLGCPFPSGLFNLSLSKKRKLAAILVPIYKAKGTERGIIDVIRFFLAMEVTVTPYTGPEMELGMVKLNEDFILNPSELFKLRAFNVTVPQVLTAVQLAQVKFIARYMKPANTHLVDVLAPDAGVFDHIVLGLSRLGSNPDTTYPGTFILHA